MWNKIQYGLIFAWAKLHAFLPMSVLYVLSDILYVLIYWVIRYRIKVVRRNLEASFPEKSEIELRRLERAFYHHFADYIVETIKLAHISPEEVLRPYQESRSGNPFAGRRTKNSDDADGPLRQLGMVQRLQPGIYRFVPVANLPTVK